MEEALYAVLDGALTGAHIAAGANAVSSILACAAAEGRHRVSLEGLSAAQVVRAILHAAAACKQAQAVLLDIQSAAVLYPAVVPLLAQALRSEQRQHLQETLIDLTQQQQHLLQLELQQQQFSSEQQDAQYQVQHMHQQQSSVPYLSDGPMSASATSAADAELQPWVLQLSELGVWDVLLLLGLCGNPQWEADATVVLLTAINSMQSLHRISEVFRDLSAVSDGAADWLLSVGVRWATTCYLDMDVDGPSFEQAGLLLLEGGVWSTQQLAQQGLQQIMQHLQAEADCKSSLLQVLQSSVSRCSHSIHTEQQLVDDTHHQQRSCNLGAFSPSSRQQAAGPGVASADIAAVSVQQLLAGLPQILKHSNAALAKQYIFTLQPLVAYSCDVAHALLAAAGSQLGCQSLPHVVAHSQFHPQQLMIKQELLEANQLRNATAEAAATVTALASSIADMPASVYPAGLKTIGDWPARSAGAVGREDSSVNDGLQQPSLLSNQVGSLQHQQQDPEQQQQPRSDLRCRQRYSWGFAGTSSKCSETMSAAKPQQHTPSTFATPLGNARVKAAQRSVAAAAAAAAAAAVDNSTRSVRGESGQLAPMNAHQSPLPFLSPAATPSPVLGAAVTTPQASHDPSEPAATGSLAHHDLQQQQEQCSRTGKQHQLQHRLQLCDVAASQQMLARLLQRVAGKAAGSCHFTSGLHTHLTASSALANAALPQAEQLVVALIGAVLQDGTPCSSTCCQWQLATVLQLTLQLSPAALQHVCEACSKRLQPGPLRREADHLAAAGHRSCSTSGRLNSSAVGTAPVAAAASGGHNSVVDDRSADSGADDAGTYWPMHGMWQQLLAQLLRQQLKQLSTAQAGQQPTAQHCRKHTDAAEHTQLDQSADNCIVSLPITLRALLDNLSQQVASQDTSMTAGQSNVYGELQDDSLPDTSHSLQTQVAPQLATLLGQLLLRLLEGWGISAQQGGSCSDGLRSIEPHDYTSCAAVVRSLLIRHHALSHLLAWMLQHPAAGQHVLKSLAATAGGMFATGLAVFDDSCTIGLRDGAATTAVAAAADAAVDVEGSECAAIGTDASQQHQQVEAQHAQRQFRQLLTTANASAAGVAAAAKAGLTYPDVVKRMAVQLQHMQAVLLPTALQQLLAAQDSAKAVRTQQRQAPQSGTITPAAVGCSKSISHRTGQTKQKRQSCQFFVVHTPSEKTTTASQAQPQQVAAAAAGTAATVVAAAAREEGNSEQLLPQHLLQLPILPLVACQELLSTAVSQLSSVVLQLHLRQQQQYLSVTGTDKEYGTTIGRARHRTCAAAAGSAQHVHRGSARGVRCQSSQQLQGFGAAAAAAAAPVAHSGILPASQDVPCHNHNTVSPVTSSLQQQETLQLIDIAVTSVFAWQRSLASHFSSDEATRLVLPSATTTAAAYRSSIKLLQLHQQLCALSALLRAPTGVVSKVTEVCTAEQQQQQQVEALGCVALSAAAQLLEYWWSAVAAQQLTNNATSTVAAASSDDNSATQPQQQQQQLEEYAKVLRASLAVIHLGDCAASDTAATNRTDGNLSWSNVALVIGHNVGSVSWSAMKRLQQQEELLAAALDLLIKIHQLIQAHQQEHQHEQHRSEAAAPAKTSLHPSGVLTALLQQLVLLNAAAEGIYNPAGVEAAVSTVGDARWLHKMLVSKAQELVIGHLLNPNLINHPDAARALVKLAQPSYLRPLTPKTLGPLSSVTVPCRPGLSPACSKTLALSAHLLCMHHSPRVYAAAENSIWGRQGLAIGPGPGAGPGWVVGCSRAVAAAAARMMLQLLLQECRSMQGMVPLQERLQQGSAAGSAAWQEHSTAAAALESSAAGAAVTAGTRDDRLWPPTRQLVQLWQGRTAATAAVLDCCEQLLYYCSLHANHNQRQQQQHGALAAGSNKSREAGTKAKDAKSSSSSSAAEDDHDETVDGTADLQLLLGALAAALSGPCTAAAEHMTSLLQWRTQQQQQGQVAGHPAAAGARAAEAVLQDASAAAAAGPGVAQVMTQGIKPLTKKQHKRAAAAAAADPIVLLQAQLSMLLGLGCAAGKLVLSKSSQLLQVPLQQQASVLQQHKIGAKAAVQQLMQSLRMFSSAYEHSMQALNSAAAAGGGADAGPSAAAEVATAISESLELAAERCSVQSRKEAWAAVTAAAAVVDDSSSDESDDDPVDHSAEGISPNRQRNAAAQGALANTADPAARFYDPEVHEELPCSELSESDSEESPQCESDSEELGASDDGIGEPQQQVTKARRMADPHAVSRCQLQQSVILLRAVFSSSQHSGKLAPNSKATAQQQQQVAARSEDIQPQLQQRPAPVQKLGTGAAAVAAAFAAAKARGRQHQRQQSAQLSEPCESPRPATARAAKHMTASKGESPAANAMPATPAAASPHRHQQQLVPVVCGSQHATFDPNLSRVTLPDGGVITPSAFEKLGGKGTCKKWRKSIRVVALDGARGETLGRWLSSPDTACASVQLGLGNNSRKRKHNLVEGLAVTGLTDAAEPVSDVSDVVRLCKKSRSSPRGAGGPLHGAQQLQQQQQSKGDKRVVPVPATSAETHKQQQQPGRQTQLSSQSILTAAHQLQKARQQQGDPAASSGAEARARNAFVQACLAEGRVPGYSSDEESEDDSDYSDLEDFIVVQPGKDYRQMCAEAGGKLTWKNKWQQAPGAGLRR